MNKRNRKIIISVFFFLSLIIGIGLKYTSILVIDTGNDLTNVGVKQTHAWYSTYSYRKTLTLDEAKITGSTTLTDFPVLISMTDTSLRTVANGGRVTNASGFDIVFTDTSDAVLNHEIESYNATTGQVAMWVKIPSLSNTVDTDIYMYYGNGSVSTSQENKTGVWSNGFAGVWHLGANLNDSTSNANNGTNVGATTGVAGAIGNAISSNGSAGRVTVANHASLKPSNVTLSIWAYRNGVQDTWGKPIWFGQNSASPYGPYGIQFNNASDTEVGAQIASDTTSYPVYATGSSMSDVTWTHLAQTYNGSSLVFYFNATGYTLTPGVTLGNYDGTNGLGIGGRYDGNTGQAFLGSVDEVRIANVARTADWIQAEYAVGLPANQGVGAGKYIQSASSELPVPNPSVTTSAASSITTTTATLNSSVNGNGDGVTIYYRYGPSAVDVACTSLPTSTTFGWIPSSSSPNAKGISGLTPGTAYRFCAYASNGVNTTYGTVLNFTTAVTVPILSSPTSASITGNSALLGGNITSQGASAVLSRGVCYSVTATNANPQSGGSGVTCVQDGANTATGIFTQTVTGLTHNINTYSYTAYAVNTQGTGYSTAGTFITPNVAPTTVGTATNGTPDSYKVTLNGSANPNGYPTFGHFRLFTEAQNPGNCNADSGGIRFPLGVGNFPDIDLGSGTSLITSVTTPAFTYTIPLNSAQFLYPNTTYYYCAYAINTANSTQYTTGGSSIVSFTTPDGPSSPCDAPASGNLDIPSGAVCNFTGSFNGVDSGTGTKNTALMTVNAGVTLSITAGQSIAFGSISLKKGSRMSIARGGTLASGGVFVHDEDVDNYLDDVQQYVGKTPPAGYKRRNLISSVFNYSWKIASSGATFDCNNTTPYAYRTVQNLVQDVDNDGYKTSTAAGPQCVGAAAVLNGRTYYNDGSGPN